MPSPLLPRARRWAPLAAAVFALASCKGSEPTPTAAGPADIGGTMVIATSADAGTMLPALVNGIVDREVTDLLYDRLAQIGPNMITIGDQGFTPQLAEKWEWSPDSLSIVFHLNPRARWHDGRPVRASDVRFSLATMKNPATGSPAAPLITNIDSVAVRDSLTAVAYFKRHTPEQFYDFVYQVLVMPEHVLGNTPAGELKTAEAARGGIGSGRFRLVKWVPGQRIELMADTANYRGRPKLDRVVFSISPDYAAAVTRFFSGDADFHEQLRPEHLAKIASDTMRRSVRYPNFQYTYLAFNLVDPTNPAQPNPIFSDRAVRRALTMAVDRRAMLRNVFDTLGQPLYGPFPPSVSVADSTIAQLPYDTAKARALLDSAGWVMGPGAVRVKNGRRLEFALSTPSSSAPRHAYSVLLQEAFRRIGVAMKIDETDAGSYGAKQAKRGFDAELASYGTDPSPTGFKQSWGTSGIKEGSNFPAYSNPMVDALLDSAAASFDFAHTRAYARRAFETIVEDAPGIWLYQPLTVAGIDKRIHVGAMPADGYWGGMADWWIPASQRTARDKIGLRTAQ
jgi:peptide/nickel transport system substrate-binding protein